MDDYQAEFEKLLATRSGTRGYNNGFDAATLTDAVIMELIQAGVTPVGGTLTRAATRGARQVFTAQEDIGKIWSSGRVWGQTEGSVYGMTAPNASRLRTMIDTPIVDPGTIVFRGNAAKLFKPHEVVGPFSGMKRLLGQQKAGFGDVIFVDAYKVGNRVYVYEAHIGSHLGQSTNFAMSRLWTRRIVIDGTLDVGIGVGVGAAGVYLWNQE